MVRLWSCANRQIRAKSEGIVRGNRRIWLTVAMCPEPNLYMAFTEIKARVILS